MSIRTFFCPSLEEGRFLEGTQWSLPKSSLVGSLGPHVLLLLLSQKLSLCILQHILPPVIIGIYCHNHTLLYHEETLFSYLMINVPWQPCSADGKIKHVQWGLCWCHWNYRINVTAAGTSTLSPLFISQALSTYMLDGREINTCLYNHTLKPLVESFLIIASMLTAVSVQTMELKEYEWQAIAQPSPVDVITQERRRLGSEYLQCPHPVGTAWRAFCTFSSLRYERT